MKQSGVNKLSTGFTALDDYLGGIAENDVLFVAARPGMGKTAFALDIAVNLAANSNKRVAFISFEDSKEQIIARVLKRKYCPESLIKGTTSNAIGTIVVYGSQQQHMRSINEMIATAGEFDLIILDSFQRLSCSGKNKSERTERALMTIKEAAVEYHTPIILLSQLSRRIEQRKDHRPQIRDISCSSQVTRCADTIMLLYREAYYDYCANQTSAWCFIGESPLFTTRAVPQKWHRLDDDGMFI